MVCAIQPQQRKKLQICSSQTVNKLLLLKASTGIKVSVWSATGVWQPGAMLIYFLR